MFRMGLGIQSSLLKEPRDEAKSKKRSLLRNLLNILSRT